MPNSIAEWISVILGLCTLASVIFGAGMQWASNKLMQRDINELKQRREKDYGFIEQVKTDIAVIKSRLEIKDDLSKMR